MTTAAMVSVEFVAYGRPAPQGSKRAIPNRHTGRISQVESSRALKPWREDVRQAALGALPSTWFPLDGPLAVVMVFTMPKPVAAPKRRRSWPDRTPDLSKLCRGVEDAITSAGVWRDDARVVEYDRLAKVFPGEDVDALDRPGVRVRIRQVSE